jgi:hypothetical protein
MLPHPCQGRTFKFRVQRPRLGRRTAPRRERFDLEDADVAVDGEAQNVADPDGGVGTIDDAAAEAKASALGKGLGQRAGFDDAREPQEFIKAQAVSHA